MRLRDRVAFIAGAGASSPGWSNGKAVSVLLAREGAKIFALDRSPDHLAETIDAIRSEGGECVAQIADVTSEADVKAAMARCMALYGRIDVPFNSVGLQAIGGPEDIEEDVWDVAKAVAFLASDDAKYITATELVVDGGLSASALGHPWSDDEKNL